MNMHDEDRDRPLEERLTDEAQRMLDDSVHPPITILRAEIMRRQRRSALAKTVCTVAAVIAVAFVAINVKRRPPVDGGRAPSVADDRAQPGTNNSEGTLPLEADVSATPIANAESRTLPAMAIAILIPAADDSGEPQFMPGWYVPEQIEVLRADDLSAAERRAASRLLGLEFEGSDDEII
jgi:hypothetical protein